MGFSSGGNDVNGKNVALHSLILQPGGPVTFKCLGSAVMKLSPEVKEQELSRPFECLKVLSACVCVCANRPADICTV